MLTYRGEDRCSIIKRASELPLLASFVRFRLQHHCFHDLEVVLAYIVLPYNHFFNGCEQNKRDHSSMYVLPIRLKGHARLNKMAKSHSEHFKLYVSNFRVRRAMLMLGYRADDNVY